MCRKAALLKIKIFLNHTNKRFAAGLDGQNIVIRKLIKTILKKSIMRAYYDKNRIDRGCR